MEPIERKEENEDNEGRKVTGKERKLTHPPTSGPYRSKVSIGLRGQISHKHLAHPVSLPSPLTPDSAPSSSDTPPPSTTLPQCKHFRSIQSNQYRFRPCAIQVQPGTGTQVTSGSWKPQARCSGGMYRRSGAVKDGRGGEEGLKRERKRRGREE